MFIMKIFILLLSFLTIEASEFCYGDVVKACTNGSNSDYENCNAKYGGIKHVMCDLQTYANLHVTRSFDYLLFSTYFGTYQKNRNGFQKLFRKLSDTAWEDSINLIQYITRRGGRMDFNARPKEKMFHSYELSELEGLSRALDSQKLLTLKAYRLHAKATREEERYHDPEFTAYLENKFLRRQADTIRDLAGHVTDLKNMITVKDGLPVYLFDEYLRSKY